MARGLAGEVEEKTWALGIGNRNSGKGVLFDVFKNAFEDYVTSITAEELLINRVGDGDIAKKLGWTIPLEFKRLYFSNEIKTEDDRGQKLKLDSTIIKKLTGGGDEISARLNYKDEIKFKIQGKFIFFANDPIRVSRDDVLQTLKTFSFNSEFVEELSEEHERINKLGDYHFCVADPTIKSIFLKREDVIDAIVHIIIDNYSDLPIRVPDMIKENKKDLLDDVDKDEMIIRELFVITKDPLDYISISSVNSTIIQDRRIDKGKAKLIFKKLGVTEGKPYYNIDNEKKQIRSYIGIKEIKQQKN